MFMVFLSRPILTGAADQRHLCARLWCADCRGRSRDFAAAGAASTDKGAYRDTRASARALALGRELFDVRVREPREART
jgi:hypothetical protein